MARHLEKLFAGLVDDDEPATTTESRRAAQRARRKALDDLDRVGAIARTPTAIQLGGGSFTVQRCRQVEVARLRALWQQ